jgi:hypothetical protein
MKKIDVFLILKYLSLTVFVVLVLYVISITQDIVSSSFDFYQLHLVHFVGFTLIGSALHIVDHNIFNKDSWELKLKPEILIFVMIYFFISISLLATIGFLINIYLKLGVSTPLTIMLIPFQILLGYTFIRLFLKRK